MDTQSIAKLLAKTPKVVTVEEHNVIGGLYSAIAEAMALENMPLPNLAIGLQDTFAHGYGQLSDVRRANGLDSETIYQKVRAFANQ